MSVMHEKAAIAMERIRKGIQSEGDVQTIEHVLRVYGWIPGAQAYAVYHATQGWLVDTCAGGTWGWEVAHALWFPSNKAAIDCLREADMCSADANRYFVLRVQ